MYESYAKIIINDGEIADVIKRTKEAIRELDNCLFDLRRVEPFVVNVEPPQDGSPEQVKQLLH